MQSCEFVTFISSIACAISQTCSSEELSLIGAIFTQLGDTLTTLALHDEICSKKS